MKRKMSKEKAGKQERKLSRCGTSELVRGVHNIIAAQMTAEPATASTARCDGACNTLPSWLLEATLRDHVNLVRKGNNHVLIGAETEVVGHDIFAITLNSVRVFSACQNLLHGPGDDEGAGSGNDGSLVFVDTSVETSRGKC